MLAKRLGAAPGSTAVLELEGSAPFAFRVSDTGRGERLSEEPEEPDVRLRMDRESFIRLAGGRREPEPGSVRIEGDADLGQRIVDALATTP